MRTFYISGRVIDIKTQQGIQGLRVEAWDKDLLVDDLVGSVITNKDGIFQIQFDEFYFNDLFLDRQPDLFFKVYKKDRLLKSTEDSVLWNVSSEETTINIEIEYQEDGMPSEKVPVEIPWKLASTTQVLKQGGPNDTTISLFYYEPQLESLQKDYPDERLIYLKFTVSVSPYQPDAATFGDFASKFLEEELPIWHLLLDLKVTPVPHLDGTIKPYFHAASPTHRNNYADYLKLS
jgi:hypothetical protein